MRAAVLSISCSRGEHLDCPIFERCRCQCHRDWRRLGIAREIAARHAAAQLAQYFDSDSYSHAGNIAALLARP